MWKGSSKKPNWKKKTKASTVIIEIKAFLGFINRTTYTLDKIVAGEE